MEQLYNYNAMLANMQTPQTAQTAKKSDGVQQDGFQKLLEQKADTQVSSKQEKTEAPQKTQEAQSAENPQKTQDAQETRDTQETQQAEPVGEDKELEERMLLAAMAMLQNPVVQAEQVLTPEVQNEAVVDEAAPLVAETLLTPETQSFTQEPERTVEIPVEDAGTQTVDQAPVEDIPQPIEAPEASQKTEERTVEVKVETGEAGPQAEEETEDTPEVQDAGAEKPVFEDVKAVPVKVGEAPRAEKAEQPVEEQIAPKLTEALQNGETRVELQLTPENLGKVTVEMTWSDEGGLVVQLHAENRETQNLLSRNTTNLVELLGRETQQEVRVEVPRQEESQRQDLYEQQQEQQRRQQQEQRRKQESSGEDFLQQLRLGLISLDGE